MSSLIFKIRRKLCWLYGERYIKQYFNIRGRLSLFFFNKLYPQFTVGSSPNVWGRFYVMMYDPYGSEITIGDNAHVVSDFRRSGITLFSPCKFTTLLQGKITIGDNVQLNGATLTCRKRIDIGSGTLIAPNCIIMDSDFHVSWPPENRGQSNSADEDKEVLIGENVWLGLNVTVLKGAVIGNNSIIGAGSLVVGEIPPNVIAAGVPAKVVKTLSDN